MAFTKHVNTTDETQRRVCITTNSVNAPSPWKEGEPWSWGPQNILLHISAHLSRPLYSPHSLEHDEAGDRPLHNRAKWLSLTRGERGTPNRLWEPALNPLWETVPKHHQRNRCIGVQREVDKSGQPTAKQKSQHNRAGLSSAHARTALTTKSPGKVINHIHTAAIFPGTSSSGWETRTVLWAE